MLDFDLPSALINRTQINDKNKLNITKRQLEKTKQSQRNLYVYASVSGAPVDVTVSNNTVSMQRAGTRSQHGSTLKQSSFHYGFKARRALVTTGASRARADAMAYQGLPASDLRR